MMMHAHLVALGMMVGAAKAVVTERNVVAASSAAKTAFFMTSIIRGLRGGAIVSTELYDYVM